MGKRDPSHNHLSPLPDPSKDTLSHSTPSSIAMGQYVKTPEHFFYVDLGLKIDEKDATGLFTIYLIYLSELLRQRVYPRDTHSQHSFELKDFNQEKKNSS